MVYAVLAYEKIRLLNGQELDVDYGEIAEFTSREEAEKFAKYLEDDVVQYKVEEETLYESAEEAIDRWEKEKERVAKELRGDV